MQIPLSLFKFVAKASLDFVGAGAIGDIGLIIAEKVMDRWKAEKDEAARKAELTAIAVATTAEIKNAIDQVLDEIAEGSQREAVATYLMFVPASIRQTFRRATDPSGKTIPAGLNMRSVQDLATILPGRLPRYRSGDFPIPGVSRMLVELIGVGGFGEVWKAVNPDLPFQPPVALKFSTDPATREELVHSKTLLARILSDGKKAGIVELINTYLRADPPCLEYEYVAGGELTGLIREYHSRGGMTSRDSAKIIHRLAKTVGHFHRLNPPIVHRDLKPANILVHAHAPGKITLKIADFGIGGIAAKGEIGRSQTLMSGQGKLHTIAKGAYTPLYASPEQIRGDGPDCRDDVHALGIIWYQLLTGDLSRGAPTGIGWMANLRARSLSQQQIDLVASCFDSDKNERPTDAGVLAEATFRIFELGSGPVTPPPHPPISPPTEILYINSKRAKASGYSTSQGFVVLKGSEARIEPTPTIPSSAIDLRKGFLEKGILSRKDEMYYEFTKDHAFKTSSSAASVVLGSSASGPAEWKDKTGKRLKDILKEAKS